jgi:hypothetical protein
MFNRKKYSQKALIINLLKNKNCNTCVNRRGSAYCIIDPKIQSCIKWESLKLFLIKHPEYKNKIIA